MVEAIFDCLAKFDGKSRLIVDRAGRLVASSSCVGAIFNDGGFLKLERGHVLSVRNSNDELLHALLAVNDAGVETAALRSRDRRGHMLIRASALDESLVCLSVTNSEFSEESALPDLEALFGLTPSEAGIVRDLYQGKTARWIAEDHHNSIHTIRAHIRHCYDKMGVSCREELWSRLNDYRVR